MLKILLRSEGTNKYQHTECDIVSCAIVLGENTYSGLVYFNDMTTYNANNPHRHTLYSFHTATGS